MSLYVRKANVDHTISGQGTAVSTLDHSVTTPRTSLKFLTFSKFPEPVGSLCISNMMGHNSKSCSHNLPQKEPVPEVEKSHPVWYNGLAALPISGYPVEPGKPGDLNCISPGPEMAWKLPQKVRKPGQHKRFSRKPG